MTLLRALALVACSVVVGAPAHAEALRVEPGRHAAFHAPELPHAKPEAAPQRIVSLAPILTETLFAVGAGPRVVGVTRYCDQPKEALALPKVGGYVDPQLEAMLTLKPDLVIAMPSLGQRAVLDALRAKGIPVLVGFAESFEEVHDLIRTIGDVVDRKAAADALLASVDARLAAVAARAQARDAHPRAIVAVSTNPLIVAGPGTFAAEALALVGAVAAVPRTAPAWPVWSLENLAAARVDVIVSAEGGDALPVLQGIAAKAVRRAPPRVVGLPGFLLMRPGPSIASDVEALERLLFPEAPKP
jgi:iron complex transport system substrate-binding protein